MQYNIYTNMHIKYNIELRNIHTYSLKTINERLLSQLCNNQISTSLMKICIYVHSSLNITI